MERLSLDFFEIGHGCPISFFLVFGRGLGRTGVVEGPQVPELNPCPISGEFFFVSDFEKNCGKKSGKKIREEVPVASRHART